MNSAKCGGLCTAIKYKLTTAERATLNQALIFTCGAVLSDLELCEERLDGEHMFVWGLRCYEPLEKLYYSVGSYVSTAAQVKTYSMVTDTSNLYII